MILCTLIGLFLSTGHPSGAADKVAYPPQRLSSRGVKRIEIIGVKGRLNIVGRQGRGYHVSVAHSRRERPGDWSLLVERRGSSLVFEVTSAAYGREWNRVVRREQWPEFDLEIAGPSVPIVVSWREGKVAILDWRQSVQASLLSGSLQAQRGRGVWHLQTVDSGALEVTDFVGELNVHGQRGRVAMASIRGQLNLNWQHGPLQLSEISATGRIETVDSEIDLRGGRGRLQLITQGGVARVQRFAGRLDAQGETTEWTLALATQGELSVRSLSGGVRVSAPKRMRVWLESLSGQIVSPFASEDRDGRQVVEQRLTRGPAADLFVRTETGDITVKY